MLPRTNPNKTSPVVWGPRDYTSGKDSGHWRPWEGSAGRPSRRAWFAWYSCQSSFFQKIPKTEQDGAGTHLTVSGVLGEGCDQVCDSVYSAIARTRILKDCARVEGR